MSAVRAVTTGSPHTSLWHPGYHSTVKWICTQKWRKSYRKIRRTSRRKSSQLESCLLLVRYWRQEEIWRTNSLKRCPTDNCEWSHVDTGSGKGFVRDKNSPERLRFVWMGSQWIHHAGPGNDSLSNPYDQGNPVDQEELWTQNHDSLHQRKGCQGQTKANQKV